MATLGVAPITVFSRTHARSLELAELFGGRAVVAEGLMEALQQCDIIVGCTSAPHHVITCDHIAEAVQHRAGRPLVVIDLGLPPGLLHLLSDGPWPYPILRWPG